MTFLGVVKLKDKHGVARVFKRVSSPARLADALVLIALSSPCYFCRRACTGGCVRLTQVIGMSGGGGQRGHLTPPPREEGVEEGGGCLLRAYPCADARRSAAADDSEQWARKAGGVRSRLMQLRNAHRSNPHAAHEAHVLPPGEGSVQQQQRHRQNYM